jgi:hypothetical protein
MEDVPGDVKCLILAFEMKGKKWTIQAEKCNHYEERLEKINQLQACAFSQSGCV